MTDQSTASAPRVTLESIEALIATEHYFTALEGVAGAQYVRRSDMQIQDIECAEHLALLTICVLVLRNGYTVIGKSACASPENFNPEIGRDIARENAIREIWPLEGYALRNKLAEV